MKNFLIISIWLCVTVAAAPQAATRNDPSSNDDDDDDFSLVPTKRELRTCHIPGLNVTEGICVDAGDCSEQFLIDYYDMIDSDCRISVCPGGMLCCVPKNMSLYTMAPEISTPPPPRGCRTGLKDSCPWCAAVYRNNPRTDASEIFCGGAVVGSRFVLTTASCALARRRSDLWIQLPGGTRQYPVNTTVNHKEFNSGTRENDIALLLLNEDVVWPEGQKDDLGACLGLGTPLEGNCVSVGFNDNNQLKFTPLTISANNCSERGCEVSGSCSVAQGSPVLCPFDSDDLVMAGLVRQTCKKDSTSWLESLMPSTEWFSQELTNLGLSVSRHTIFSQNQLSNLTINVY